MKTPGSPVSSLWLLAAREDEAMLQAAIEELAARHGTPAFRPHLTLLGDIAQPPEGMAGLSARIAGAAGPFALPVADVLGGAAFFRSFYALFARNAELDALRGAAEGLFGPAASGFMPHVSLLYGSVPEPAKAESLAAMTSRLAGRTIRFDRLAVTNSGDDVPIGAWRAVHVARLAG